MILLSLALIAATNSDRLSWSLNPLQINPKLTLAAHLAAEDMAKNGYFSHNPTPVLTPWHWLDLVNYNYIYAGQNLAEGYQTANQINTAWLNSPTHKANLLNKNYNEIGIAIAKGDYKGGKVTFVVEFFGSTKDTIQNKETDQELKFLN